MVYRPPWQKIARTPMPSEVLKNRRESQKLESKVGMEHESSFGKLHTTY